MIYPNGRCRRSAPPRAPTGLRKEPHPAPRELLAAPQKPRVGRGQRWRWAPRFSRSLAPGLLGPRRPVWDAKQEAEGKERGAAGRGAPGAAPRFEGAATAPPPALGRGGAAQALPAGGAPSLGCPPSAASLGTLCGGKAGEPKAARFRPEEAAGRAKPAPSGGEDSAAQLAISKRANCRAGAWAGKHKAEITRWVPGEIKGACCRSRRHT